MKSKNLPYIHRDISWLSFNYRVLQESKDPSVPLLERLKFLAIYSSNLDEFFRVRVAGLKNLVRVGKKTKAQLEFSPKEVLTEVLKIVNKQQAEFSDIFENQIVPELSRYHINILRRTELNEEQSDFLHNYFEENMLPFVQPVLLVPKKIKPFLNNAALYLTLQMKEEPGLGRSKDRYAILKIPSDHLPRFIELPAADGEHDLIILDDVVRFTAGFVFPGYEIIDAFSVKLTRDAELYIEDEFSGDLVSKIKRSLSKRNVGPPSRLVFDRTMTKELLNILKDTFDLDDMDLLPEGRYHNNFDFFGFPDFGYEHLKNNELPPIPYSKLENVPDIFEAIKAKDHMIHVPYNSYESVVRLFEVASHDPDVTHIKIVQYRVARKSRIMNALMDAVKLGKQVTVFVEVKARFDEEANLRWGEKLEKAGVNVRYSFPGLKVHSKIALIARKEAGKIQLYSYLSSGNFHEGTAKVYSDFGLFTADPRLTMEVGRVFSFLETVKVPRQKFKHLLVGQFNLREALTDKINREIKHVKAGKKAEIILKLNSLQDQEMIEKLYEASQAGVRVRLIVRGICSLVPGVKGISENIEAISIVDRFLEHSRIFIFHNNGEPDIYISSADWMVRNLSHRIETTFPIYDPDIRNEIIQFVKIQLLDNVKARILDSKMSNKYIDNNAAIPVRAQIETYFETKRKEENELLEEHE